MKILQFYCNTLFDFIFHLSCYNYFYKYILYNYNYFINIFIIIIIILYPTDCLHLIVRCTFFKKVIFQMNWFISQMYFITSKDAFVYDSISTDTLKVTLYPMNNVIFFVMLLLIVFQ